MRRHYEFRPAALCQGVSVPFLRVSLLICAAFALSGCNGFGSASVPQATASLSSVAESAHRPLAATSSGTDRLASLPSGSATADPFHLSAIPAPLSAFPAIGQPPASSIAANCGQLSSSDKKVQCPAKIRSDVAVRSASTAVQFLDGLMPGAIQQIYGLNDINMKDGQNSTVAIVVAFDDPVIESDVAVYRAAFGLPPCTSSNGCFTKIAADGSKSYPAINTGWAVETATDAETVSAVCPACKIMIVEAASANIPDLAVAVDRAAASGATVISNSYGVAEAADNVRYDSHFDHPGVAIVAAAGDQGYGAMFPASSEYVTAVGGTSLYQSDGGISETAWTLTNSGCSAYIPKPSWQHDRGCSNRTMNDIAVVADPSTGMAVYDSILDGVRGGWTIVGGTSIGAPIVSSIIAMSKHPGLFAGAHRFYEAKRDSYFAITAGSNGICAITYLCNAAAGYSAPVGLGSPHGDHAFNS